MAENIEQKSELNPESLERNRLLEEHRRLGEELDALESKIDSFFRKPGPYRPEDKSEISGLHNRSQEIVNKLRMLEEELFDLDTNVPT